MTAQVDPARARVVRQSPGRLRVHLPDWDGDAPEVLEAALETLAGVRSASARGSTGNALIEFEEGVIEAQSILRDVDALLAHGTARRPPAREAKRPAAPAEPTAATEATEATDTAEAGPQGRPRPVRSAAAAVGGVLREQAGRFGRARIAVRGLDRDPQLARRVVAALERRPEVRRATASATTGRVLVEFSDRVTSLQDLLADISKLELPDVSDEDRPAHPLDPAPIVQSAARTVGAALGLGLLTVQRLVGSPPNTAAAAAVAGGLGIVDGSPPMREGLRNALGRDRAQLLLGGAAIVSLTLSGSPLGLMVSGASALRVFTEARLRRDAWKEYERRLEQVSDAQPGAVVRLEAGSRIPLMATVLEGTATVTGADGLPDAIGPGDEVAAGARVLCGAVVVELCGGRPWEPQPRPGAPRPDSLQRYVALIGPASLAYAVVYAVKQRSLAAAFTGLLLVNPRAGIIGSEAADAGAAARVLRGGVTVVGTRADRQIRRPDVLILDGPRVITDGLEQTRIISVEGRERAELADVVAAMASVPGSPWGANSRTSASARVEVADAHADGVTVTGTIGGRPLRLEPADPDDESPEVRRAIEAGEQAVLLRDGRSGAVIAHVHLRPRLATGLEELRRRCERAGVELALLERDDRRASRMVASRAHIPLVIEADLAELVRDRQRMGDRVAVLSDTPRAAEAFDACDMAIALSSGRSSQFQARADLLAPGLPAVSAIIAAGARREQAGELAVIMSVASNVAGAAWGLQGEPALARASSATYVGALAAIGAAWERLRGGRRSRSVVSRLSDPRPERWGRAKPEEVLGAMGSRMDGLTSSEAQERQERRSAGGRRNAFIAAMSEQLQSPLVAVLGAGAGVSLAVGATADVLIIGAVVLANAAVGAWQERQAGQAAQALEQMGAASARVLRDREVREIPATEVVRGDVLLLGPGDRVVADARLIDADALEVDEAALTGESLPVAKEVDAAHAENRIVLEGSDVTVGSARAIVVAVGERTRLGATAAALAVEETRESPLGVRLDRLFRQGMPIVVGGGLLVTLAGIAWGGAPLAQLAVGASVAIAAVPEGLPLLAGVAEAAVARRLAGRSALVRRLSSVESLGRVDVVCSDKTGTLTRGQLEVTLVDDFREAGEVGEAALAPSHRDVLLAAALASPEPGSPDADAHATDRAVLSAAADAGLRSELLVRRRDEAPFDPVRSLHATALEDRVCIKGAAEVVVPRCTHVRRGEDSPEPLDESAREELLARAETLAARGLRVLMVADGAGGTDVDDPAGLTARGLVGISDPPREGAAEAVRRCHAAGIRVIMLTGDHPATARRIAADLGLLAGEDGVLTGEELENVEEGSLGELLESTSVVARITPIDKLRIVECLQRGGHTVAMTGDGVNDAPALRLADVGVAMGAGGTEVARQAADLVLADDQFATLTDALLEGRSLWENLHEALGLLLGGNLGEMVMMAGAAVLGRGAVLSARQILAINLVTDVLPAVAVAVQPPRETELEQLASENEATFDQKLLGAIVARGIATSVPALAAVLLAPLLGAQAQAVAFGSIIATQLAQTVASGKTKSNLTPPVLGAVGASAAVLGASLLVPPLRAFLQLPAVTPQSLLLIAATAPGARALAAALRRGRVRPRALLSAPAGRAALAPSRA